MCFLPLVGSIVWYGTLILSFHKSGEALTILLVNLLLTVAVITLQSRYLKGYRKNFMYISICAAGASVLAIGASQPNEFIKGIRNCVYNYWQFWGVLLLFMLALTFLAIFKRKNYPVSAYFGQFALNIFLFSVFAKLSDGGAGNQVMICRIGWGDSLNRSLMHLMGLVLLASVFILTEKNVEGRSRSTTSI
jgi:hypothetical protein